jgi:hypothetical protein
MRERRSSHSVGKRLVDGLHFRTAPPADSVWSTTFNLRWWQHAEQEQEQDQEHDTALTADDESTRKTGVGSPG